MAQNKTAVPPPFTGSTAAEHLAVAVEVIAQRETDRAKYQHSPAPTAREIEAAVNDGELGDARLFCDLFRSRRCYDLAADKWYRWAGHFWEEHDGARILSDVDELVGIYLGESRALDTRIAEKAGKGEKSEREEKYRDELRRRVRDLHRVRRREDVLKQARSGIAGDGSFDRLGIRGTEWDAKPYMLACANGVIELTRAAPYWRKRDGRPDDYLKCAAPTEWVAIDAPAPQWQRFLGDIFEDHPEIVPYLARLFGYALAGHPVERVFPIFWGGGANGKGTLVDTAQGVLGKDVAGQVDAELFLRNKAIRNSAGPRPDILALRGMRLAVASETAEGRQVDAAELKRLTGMDTLVGRNLNSRTIVQFRQTHTLVQLTNHRPGADAADQALWDRMHLVPFTRRFVKPGDDEGDATARPINENLRDELMQEAPGILAWLVRGWCDYAARATARPGSGLDPPEVVRQTTRGYRAEQDVEGRFLRECCEEAKGVSVKAGVLRDAFARWCDENGLRGSLKRLTERVRERHDPGKPTNRGTFYPGLRLLAEQEQG